MLNISGICTRLYMTGDDLDCLGESRPYPHGAWQGKEALLLQKQLWQPYTCILHTKTPQVFSYMAGRRVAQGKREIKIKNDEEAFMYLSAIWSHIWWSSRPIHHPYCDRWQNHWPGSQLQLQNTAFPLKNKTTKEYSDQKLESTARQQFVLPLCLIGWLVIAAGTVWLRQRQRW